MTKMKRPIIVVVAQGILLVFAVIWFSALVFNLAIIISVGSAASPFRLIGGVLVIVGVASVLTAAFWGLAKRRVYGKWLGVLSLSFLWLITLLIQIRPSPGQFQRFEYNSVGEMVGAIIAIVLINGLLLLVILKLAFSKSVDKFFRPQ